MQPHVKKKHTEGWKGPLRSPIINHVSPNSSSCPVPTQPGLGHPATQHQDTDEVSCPSVHRLEPLCPPLGNPKPIPPIPAR